MFAEGATSAGQMAAHPGEAFREMLPYVLLGAVVIIVLQVAYAAKSRSRDDARARWSLWEKLVYLATVVSVTVLGLTSFAAMLRDGELGGWPLFLHMVGAGMFTFTLPIIALTWCEAARFDLRGPGERGQPTPRRFYWVTKLMFWTLLISGLIVTMTMLISMLPIFGTDGLHTLLDLHRYSGLVVVVALMFHLSSVILRRLGWR